ncbi:hypothetical protein BOX15_Mlig001414g4 [Macrostomum lignano]|uniref:Uncharacterized protein n=1 Tax=Macrostomum lignano TaxID=282301 RepID=A0A267EWT7_9PLAT|nr:hypothetical protein BOX15_Mlig001414g4 [Macrostomum lignano]
MQRKRQHRSTRDQGQYEFDHHPDQRKHRHRQFEHQPRPEQQRPRSYKSGSQNPTHQQPSHTRQSNQQNSGCSARNSKPKPANLQCNMATTVSYPTGARSCEMIGWHVANMDAKLNALFDTMSEIYKDTAMLAGESEAEATAGMQELVEPSIFTMLQRESASWDPSVMNKKVSQLVLIGSWIYHRTQSVVNK